MIYHDRAISLGTKLDFALNLAFFLSCVLKKPEKRQLESAQTARLQNRMKKTIHSSYIFKVGLTSVTLNVEIIRLFAWVIIKIMSQMARDYKENRFM